MAVPTGQQAVDARTESGRSRAGDPSAPPEAGKFTSESELAELAELRQLVAEQTRHLDQLVARVQAMTGREAELRAFYVEAHERLAQRDDELRRLRAQARELQALVNERTAWAQALDRETERLGTIIRELQALVEERTAWAQRLEQEVAQLRALEPRAWFGLVGRGVYRRVRRIVQS